MEIPIALRRALDELEGEGSFGTAGLADAARSLTDKYKNESGRGERLVTKKVEIAAYAVVRMPATLGAVSSALENVPETLRDGIGSVLDVGAGTGSATWAANALFPATRSFICIEREREMIALGQKLTQNDPLSEKVTWIEEDYTGMSEFPSADLVLASYTLNELTGTKRAEVLDKLADAAGKLLVIVEPGTPVGSAIVREARTRLIARGAKVLAPCPGNGPCPLPDDDWCHFTCRVARSKLHKMLKGGDAPYEDENFTYLIAVPAEATSAPQTGARILRHPDKEPGRITLKLCTEAGLVTKTVTKKDGDLFKIARKATGGEKIFE